MEYRRKLYIGAGISKQEKHIRLLFAPPVCQSYGLQSSRQWALSVFFRIHVNSNPRRTPKLLQLWRQNATRPQGAGMILVVRQRDSRLAGQKLVRQHDSQGPRTHGT